VHVLEPGGTSAATSAETSVGGRTEVPSLVGGKRRVVAAAVACGSAVVVVVVAAALASGDGAAGAGAGVVDAEAEAAGGEPRTQRGAVGCFVGVGSCHHSTSS